MGVILSFESLRISPPKDLSLVMCVKLKCQRRSTMSVLAVFLNLRVEIMSDRSNQNNLLGVTLHNGIPMAGPIS